MTKGKRIKCLYHMYLHNRYFRIEQFRCTFCSFVSELSENCKKHIIKDHKNWQADLKENAEALKQTCHTNPNWLADLTQNFKETVISKCSERVQNAVDTNEIIQVFISKALNSV